MERTLTPEFPREVEALLTSIHLKYGYDFRNYAPASLARTLVQAMTRMGFRTLGALQAAVLKDTACFDDLIQILTITVSELFRDPSYFRALRQHVMPVLGTYPSLKIWVAGCSTGEEVYSLAILLHEVGLLERTTVYATDINAKSLDIARGGTFLLLDVERAAPRYHESGGTGTLTDYYQLTGTSAAFNESLKNRITFADHSLVTDAAFSEMQLISCRNVLIYFKQDLKDRALDLFWDSLCRRGFLGLGSMETIRSAPHTEHFAPFVRHDRIFRKSEEG